MTTRQRCGSGRWLADLSAFSVIRIVWSWHGLFFASRLLRENARQRLCLQFKLDDAVESNFLFVIVAGELPSVLLVPSPLASRVCRATRQSSLWLLFRLFGHACSETQHARQSVARDTHWYYLRCDVPSACEKQRQRYCSAGEMKPND